MKQQLILQGMDLFRQKHTTYTWKCTYYFEESMGINPQSPLESLDDWWFVYSLMIDVLNIKVSLSVIVITK